MSPYKHGEFMALAPDLPGAVGGGYTPEEAVSELVLGIAAILEHADELGVPLPKPTG